MEVTYDNHPIKPLLKESNGNFGNRPTSHTGSFNGLSCSRLNRLSAKFSPGSLALPFQTVGSRKPKRIGNRTRPPAFTKRWVSLISGFQFRHSPLGLPIPITVGTKFPTTGKNGFPPLMPGTPGEMGGNLYKGPCKDLQGPIGFRSIKFHYLTLKRRPAAKQGGKSTG